MTIHAALGELKKLDQRIKKTTVDAKFIGYMKNSAEKVVSTNLNEEEFKTAAIASHQSITDMIKERNAIKSAVTISNATTNVKIGDVDMTVAEAIEMKTSIQYKKELLKRMSDQYSSVIVSLNYKNEDMEENLDSQITALTGKDNKAIANLDGFMEQYRAANGWKDVDPLGLKDKIDTLEKEIADFETNVDVALSTSNATTYITI